MTSSEIIQYLVLFAAAALAGGVNAVAGGGTLLTFPALVGALQVRHAADLAKVIANATSTVALFPGSISAIGAFWEDLKVYRQWIWVLTPPSLFGGLLGAVLLTRLPPQVFAAAVPWLILLAASLFTLQPRIARWFGIGEAHAAPRRETVVAVVLFQFFVGVYGGYFGAGIGILMLSALAVMGMTDIHAMNGLKSVLGTCINGVAVAVFVWEGTIDWPFAICMAAGAALGAFVAARIARRLNRTLVRRLVIAIGYALAAHFFYRRYAG